MFRLKVLGLQCRRAVRDAHGGVIQHAIGDAEAYPHGWAEHRSRLWIHDSPEERRLEAGKVHNLRTAARALNGVVIPAGEVFSFWRQVGRATRRRGYVEGRQLQEGCLIPAVGGGICQLTNALYQVALDAGCEIVERHAHSRVIPGSAAEAGRDATVAWNYIDLRFRPEEALRLEVSLTQDELIVRLAAAEPRRALFPIFATPAQAAAQSGSTHSCETCGVDTCFRHAERPELLHEDGGIAYLLDECWPEFAAYLRGMVKRADTVAVPLDGRVWGKPAYAWPAAGAGRLHTATWETLVRAFKSRRLGHYGAQRLAAQLESADALARSLARSLRPETRRVCVSQTLLPYLWRDGHLGGRRFDVLLTRTPLERLHKTLDALAARYPERGTLGEYRAPRDLVRAESAALAAAERIITPHTELAAGFSRRALLLPWQMPKTAPGAGGKAVAFPGPTAARKGAYELRNVARELDLEVVLYGAELEGEDFWRGLRTRRAERSDFSGVGAVVQPAYLEDRPRALITGLAAGLPVIATAACGLPEQPGLTLVATGDEAGLRNALASTLGITEEAGPLRAAG